MENIYGTVEMSYNSWNFVTMRIDGEGNESHWFYDRMSNLTDYYPVKQWKERAGGYRYDFLERLVDNIITYSETWSVKKPWTRTGRTRSSPPAGTTAWAG